jgi:YbbR domain-containing protein
MRFSLKQNLYLKIFSLVLAIVCWYVVRGEEERVRDYAVPLQYTNLSSSYDLSGQVIDTVAVRLRAPEPVLRAITEDRLSARIDLSRAPLGEQYITLTPGMIGVPGGARVDQVNPELIKVRIDRKIRREVPVVAEFSGAPPRGYKKVRHVIDPPTVTIEGPANEVTQVTRALTGTILLDGEVADYEVEATPIPDAPSWSRVHVVAPSGPVRVLVSIAQAAGVRERGAGAPAGGAARGRAAARSKRAFR